MNLKNFTHRICILLLLVFQISCSQKDEKHVLLISIDGLRPDFYMNEEWDAPHLKSLMETGVYANGINSVFPSVTYPSHTSIISGAYPAEHGIFYNVPRDEKNHHWNWEYFRIKTPTLWDAAQEKGLITGAVMWPVTVGAPITYNFPVRRPDGKEKGDQLSVTEPLVTPEDLVKQLRENNIITSADQFKHGTVDKTIGAMAGYIIENYKPSLMAVHFLGVDHNEHIFGRDAEEVKKTVAEVDQEIGKLLELLNKKGMAANTTIIVTGDHGFVDVSNFFSPNVLLKEAGLIEDGSWKARFSTSGGSAFLYVKEDKYRKQVEEILANLPEEQKAVFKIYNREQLDDIGADPDAAMALGMKKGWAANSTTKGTVLKNRKPGGSHGYFPDFKEIQTGFIINGPGVASPKEIKGMGIQDIAPIISQILELDFEAKNGKLIEGILK